jgi:hypothetical protein
MGTLILFLLLHLHDSVRELVKSARNRPVSAVLQQLARGAVWTYLYMNLVVRCISQLLPKRNAITKIEM